MSSRFARAVALLLSAASMVHVFAAEAAAPADAPASAASSEDGPSPPAQSGDGEFCFYPRSSPSAGKYSTVHQLRVGKGTYGSVKDLLPKLVAEARAAGADAIVDYDGAQRFGFWPWRMVHPVVHGTGIKWTGPAPDCVASGGTTLAAILASSTAPQPASGASN